MRTLTRTQPRLLDVVGIGDTQADDPSAGSCVPDDLLHPQHRESIHGRQPAPLVGIRDEAVIHEDCVPGLPRLVLQRERNQVAESASWHRVLVWEQTVVRPHGQLVAPLHGLGDEVATQSARRHRRHGFREKEPGMGSVPRPRPFDNGIEIEASARLHERSHVVPPAFAVEVRSQESARLVAEHGIHPHDQPAAQMFRHDLVRHRNEGLIGTLAALHARLLAYPSDPLVAAGRGVPLPAGLRVLPELRENVVAAGEEGAEEGDLFGGGLRCRFGCERCAGIFGRLGRCQFGPQFAEFGLDVRLFAGQISQAGLCACDSVAQRF